MKSRSPQYDAVLLPNNEVLFRSLSRKARVKPTYHARLKERYHCHAAAEFAAAYYRETGRALLHDAVKAIFHEKRQERQKKLSRMQHKAAPRPKSRRAFTQEEMHL